MTDWYCISAQFICKGNSVDNHSTETGQNKRVGRLHITCCYCICARNSQERTKRLNRAVYSYEDDKCSKLGENEEARRTHYSLWERLWVSAFLSKSGPSPFSVAQTHVLTYFTFTCVIYSGNYSITSALEEVTADHMFRLGSTELGFSVKYYNQLCAKDCGESKVKGEHWKQRLSEVITGDSECSLHC